MKRDLTNRGPCATCHPTAYRIYTYREPNGRLTYRAQRKGWIFRHWMKTYSYDDSCITVFDRWDAVLDACMADARCRAGNRAGLVDQHDMDFFP